MRVAVAVACALVVVSGAAAGVPRNAVLYSIGISTNPYGRSSPRGFGVLTGLVSGNFQRRELRTRAYGTAEWLDRGRILVQRHAPPLRSPAIFSYRSGRLARIGVAPFPGGSAYYWSPDWKHVAFEPPAPCRPGQRSLFSCYRGSRRIFVAGSGQVASGMLAGWTAGGRLVSYPTMKAWARGDAVLLELRSGRRRLRHRFWLEQQPIRSADGRYLARRRGVKNRTEIIVTRTGGRVVQRLWTHYILSMLAWSTRGHLLAYTTSGVPSSAPAVPRRSGSRAEEDLRHGTPTLRLDHVVAGRAPAPARRGRRGRLARLLGSVGPAGSTPAPTRRTAALVLPGQRVQQAQPLT